MILLKPKWVMVIGFSLLPLTPVSHAESAYIEVPYVEQSMRGLCGTTAIEMIFQYWGLPEKDQFEIAVEIATQFASKGRFRDSSFLKSDEIIYEDYPGTPTSSMNRYLKGFGTTEQVYFNPPLGEKELEQQFQKSFKWLKGYLLQDIPVIVHQYWSGPKSRGHYRIITGFDEEGEEIILLDPNSGEVIQSFEEFKEKSAVDEKELSFHMIAFHVPQ